METERPGRSGPVLGGYGSQSLRWERLGFLVCGKRQREIAFPWKEFWPLKAHVMEGQKWGLWLLRDWGSKASSVPHQLDDSGASLPLSKLGFLKEG